MTPLLLISLNILSIINLISSKITPYGNLGDPPLFITDMTLTHDQYECVYFYGHGSITDTYVQTYFEQFNEITSEAADMVVMISTINNQTNEVMDCIMQGGYNNYILPNCRLLHQWNSSWNKQSNVLVQDNVYAPYLSGNTWRLCVSNGWAGAEEFVRYQSLIVMFGIEYHGLANLSSVVTLSPTLAPTLSPTSSPTLLFENETKATYPLYHDLDIISPCDENLSIKADITLDGKEKSCLSFFGRGSLQTLHLSLNYSLHSPSKESPQDIYQGISDFAITLINTQLRQGIQFGGAYFLDDSINDTLIQWPLNLNNLYIASNLVEIDIMVPEKNRYYLNSGLNVDSPYELCLHNTYHSESTLLVNYHSEIDFQGILYKCDGHVTTTSPTQSPTLSPTLALPSSLMDYHESDNSITLSIVSLYVRSASRECISLNAGGILNSILIELTFRGNNANWASDVLLSLEDADSSECYQIEGLTVSANLPNCTSISYWPNSLNQMTSGFYNDVIDFNKPPNLHGFSSRKFCFTSTQDSESKEVHYNGTIIFRGLQLSPNPTSLPTSLPASKSVIAPYFEDDAVLIGLILLPIIIVVFILVMWNLYCRRKEQGVYKQIAIPDGSIFVIEDEEGPRDLERQSSFVQPTVIESHQYSLRSVRRETPIVKGNPFPVKSATNWFSDISGIFYPSDGDRDMSSHAEDSWHYQKSDQEDSMPVKTIHSSSISHRLQPLGQNVNIVPKSLSRTSDESPQQTPRIVNDIFSENSDEDEEEENRKLSQINRNMLLRSTSKSKVVVESEGNNPEFEQSLENTGTFRAATTAPQSLPQLKSLNQQSSPKKSSGLFQSFWSIFQGKRGSAISLQEMSARPKTSPPGVNTHYQGFGIRLDDEYEDPMADDFISPNISNSPTKIAQPPPQSPSVPPPLSESPRSPISPTGSIAKSSSPLSSPEISPRPDYSGNTPIPLSPRQTPDSPTFELQGMYKRKSTPSPTIARRASSSGSLGSGDGSGGVWATMNEKIKAEKRLKSLSTPKTSPGEYEEDPHSPSPVTSPDWFDNDAVFSASTTTPNRQEEYDDPMKSTIQTRLEFEKDTEDSPGGGDH